MSAIDPGTPSSVPDVSIITPVRNRGAFIEDAICSVLAQPIGGVEHVIVDGASTDTTPAILRRYHDTYPERITFVSEPDRGGCEGFNKGCALSRGRVLGWLGSDDRYTRDALRVVLAHFDAHPNDDVVYGDAEFIDGAGQVVGRFGTSDFSVDRALNYGACVAFPSVFYRRKVVDAVGGFRVHDVVCDHEWLVRVGKQFRLTRLPQTLCQFRLHAGSTSAAVGDLIYPRGNYLVNRRHGGRLLSPVVLRYYQSVLMRVPGARRAWERLVQYRGFPSHIRPDDRRFAIFGAALSGFRCLQGLQLDARSASSFIDNWPPTSRRYCGLPVQTPEEFMACSNDEVDAVIVATAPGSRYAARMRRQLRRLGYRRPIYCSGFSQ
ncbi:MAG: glycosyltransferase family 2 protein [Vicinamibacterales bacterium]